MFFLLFLSSHLLRKSISNHKTSYSSISYYELFIQYPFILLLPTPFAFPPLVIFPQICLTFSQLFDLVQYLLEKILNIPKNWLRDVSIGLRGLRRLSFHVTTLILTR